VTTKLEVRWHVALAPTLDDCSGDYQDAYAILSTPEQVPIEGTTRHTKVKVCVQKHLHIDESIQWQGPIKPIGFAEVWQAPGDLLARLNTPTPALEADDGLQLGPGMIGMAQ